MASKIMLPNFGGTASIWLTCMVFFQLMLLAGYSSSHFLMEKLGTKTHFRYQAGITALSLAFVFLLKSHPNLFENSDIYPSFRIFILLFIWVGLPYFVLSTTSPVLQCWIAGNPAWQNRNPYIQYGVSNVGSLAGLLSYPFFIEPNFTIKTQTALWTNCYIVYALLIFISIFIFSKNNHQGTAAKTKSAKKTGNEKLSWVAQSMLPSAALIVTTHHLTLDIANLPLLWVLPLALYLISFIICFLFPAVSAPSQKRSLLVILTIPLILFANRTGYSVAIEWKIATTLVFLFAICIYFHGNLERSKPKKTNLTSFYSYIALGGCLGSIFAGIIAPMIFNSTFESYIIVVLSLGYVVLSTFTHWAKPMKAGFVFLLLLTTIVAFLKEELAYSSDTIYRARSFYSTYSVTESGNANSRYGKFRYFIAGTHIHGVQNIGRKMEPLAYYHQGTAVGQTFLKLPEIKNVALLGLGVGVVSFYAREGDNFVFYEIDQKVVDIANKHFDYIQNTKAKTKTIIGDARLKVKEAEKNFYDLMVLDVFSSGSIPTHLITIEAVKEYLNVLSDDGLIAWNISNNHINLLPVLDGIAERLGLYIKLHIAKPDLKAHKEEATWVVMSESKKTIDKLTLNDWSWYEPSKKNRKKIYWSDEFSNIWSVIKF